MASCTLSRPIAASNFTLSDNDSGTDLAAIGLTAGTTTNGAAETTGDLSLTVNGKTVTFTGGNTYTQAQILSQINTTPGIGVTASFDATNHLVLTSNTAGAADNFTASGTALTAFGISAAATTNGADQVTNAGLSFTVNGVGVTLAGGQDYTAQDVATAIVRTSSAVWS